MGNYFEANQEALFRIDDCYYFNKRYLDLSDLSLRTIPREILRLKELEDISLSNNYLRRLPKWFFSFKNLKFLSLRGAGLKTIPKEIVKLKALEVLDISQNKLGELPCEMSQLKNLQIINYSENDLQKLPIVINKLEKLRVLNLSINKINELPKDLFKLENLENLNLSENNFVNVDKDIINLKNLNTLFLRGNKIKDLPIELALLENLRVLSLSENQITSFPMVICKLKELQILHLSQNNLTELPKEFSQLNKLQLLSLKSNQLSQIPAEVFALENLRGIFLDNNIITEISPKISQLKNLIRLSIANNKLNELPNEIGQLTKLQRINLSNNLITELPKEIGQLTNLQDFVLDRNNLIDLPNEMSKLINLKTLYLQGNKNLEEKIPQEILGSSYSSNNAEKILNYYLKVKKSGKPLNEAKIVVIGEADFGKTLLIRRLIYDDYIDTTSTTGIKIEHWKNIKINNQNIRLNVWDFGGQEIMHSTHQFFFTNRTIYILVIDARQNEDKNQINEWLKRIESFGGNSPIIIVGSHIDQNQRDKKQLGQGYFDINRREFQEKFNNIKGFYGVCSDTRVKGYDRLFNNFRNALIKEIGKLNDIHKPYPLEWFSVKEDLESMSKNNIPYISNHDYLAKCFDKKVMEEISKDTIREFLNEVGTIIYFKDLPERIVFNPEWITQGVYALVDNTAIIDNKGELEFSLLTEILNTKGYKPDDHKYILQLMRKFELCVDIIPNKRFLIPDLLMKALEPKELGDWEDSLGFQIHYETYLKNIFTQFVVKMYSLIHQKLWWRNGVVLEYEGSKALVKFYASDKKVIIKINGDNVKKRQNLLAIIRKEFKEIHDSFNNLGITEWVAHPTIKLKDKAGKEKELLKDYEELMGIENSEYPKIFVKELNKWFPVSEWLNGLGSKGEREKLMKEMENSKKNKIADSISIFGNPIFNQDVESVNISQGSMDLQDLEKIVDTVSLRMDESQKRTMEKIVDEIMDRINQHSSKLSTEEKGKFEEVRAEKWETKLKTVIPIIPKIPYFDVLPSAMIEITRTIEPKEYISTVQRWLYGNDLQTSILQEGVSEKKTKRLPKA